MIKVYINKQRDRYDCAIYKDGEYTGQGTCCYSREYAEEFKNKVENNIDGFAVKYGVAEAVESTLNTSKDKTVIQPIKTEDEVNESLNEDANGQLCFC